MTKRKGKLTWGSKGNAVTDTAFIIVVIFTFALFTLLGGAMMDEIAPALVDEFETENNDTFQGHATNYFPLFDNLFVMLLVGLWMLSLVASFLIDSHPIFFVISLGLLIFIFIVAMVISNAWEEVDSSTGLLSTASAKLPMTNFILDNLLIFAIVMGASLLLVLYGKQLT